MREHDGSSLLSFAILLFPCSIAHFTYINMPSRFARPMESDQQRMMLSNQRDNGWGISPSQSGSSMSTSNDSEGKYESANDSDMFWKDSQQRDDAVTLQNKSSEYGWAVPSNFSKAAGINSWGSPVPFKTETDGKHLSSWGHAVRRDTATATAAPVLGGLGVPRAKSGAPQRPLDVNRIGMSKHTRKDSFAVVSAHSPQSSTSPLATENGAAELDDLAHRAAQIHLGKPNPSGKGIWESLPIAVDTAHEAITLPKTSVTAALESAPSNGPTDTRTKKAPYVPVPAGRKLTSSIHATAASANKRPTKDFECGKRNVEHGGKKENPGNKARGGAAGQKNKKHQGNKNKAGNQNENRWGKAEVSRPQHLPVTEN